ncbi:MAG: YggS family pyridoxal phosphate-dependent enzyme [Bacteroidales bacterium]|nr:YggS family pyridoxal phosphate-dependent enzyme [Bacteroidales bacterium]
MSPVKENLETIIKELPQGATLVAVSKFHPSEAIREAYEAGQRIFAESRPQELEKKVAELAESCPDIEWQFIGHLQTNKLKMVLPYVSLVQSVDSVHLLKEIDKWAVSNQRTVNILLEVHVAQEETKQGFYDEEVVDLLFDAVNGKYKGVNFCGIMAMATNTDDEATVKADFQRATDLFDYLRDTFHELKDFNILSIGMSSDWRIALEEGSTMVRIGTAIFGSRGY